MRYLFFNSYRESLNLKAWGLCFLASFFLFGCSLQANKPAPVESVYVQSKPTYNKGSLKGLRYTVKKGDTLYSIAWGAGKDYKQLAWLNKLKKPYTIYPGQSLYLKSLKSVTNKSKTKSISSSTTKVSKNTAKTANNQIDSQKNGSRPISGDRSKKTLDPKVKSAYSVTSAQQNINRDIHKPKSSVSKSRLPKQVKTWRWPVNGSLIGTFSANKQGRNGIKIKGRRGDLVKAAADGRVVYAGNALRGYGNLVIIKHSDDYLSAYAHADSILVKEKQNVTAGQLVAKMGSTGTDKVMLHFEIRRHGKSVNPLNYLPKR